MHITIQKRPAGKTLSFTVEDGKISGEDAAEIRAMISTWDGEGVLYGTQGVKAPNPEGSLRDLAVMLFSRRWKLPDELTDLLPEPEEVPEGAVA